MKLIYQYTLKAKLQWTVKQIGLSKSETHAARQVSHAGLHRKRLAQAEEVVG